MGKKSSPKPLTLKAQPKQKASTAEKRQGTRLYADRPDQYNAMGSLTYQRENVIDPATGQWTTKWTQRENMSDDMRNIYNSQMSNYKNQSRFSSRNE